MSQLNNKESYTADGVNTVEQTTVEDSYNIFVSIPFIILAIVAIILNQYSDAIYQTIFMKKDEEKDEDEYEYY